MMPRAGAHYHSMYASILAPYRHRTGLVMAEVGANQGDSLNTWVKYFGDSLKKIFGLRYGISDSMMHPCEGAHCSKIKIIDSDQSKLSELRKFVRESLGSETIPRAEHALSLAKGQAKPGSAEREAARLADKAFPRWAADRLWDTTSSSTTAATCRSTCCSRSATCGRTCAPAGCT